MIVVRIKRERKDIKVLSPVAGTCKIQQIMAVHEKEVITRPV